MLVIILAGGHHERLTIALLFRKSFVLSNAGVAKLVNARDLKSLGPLAHAGSTPAPGTNLRHNASFC